MQDLTNLPKIELITRLDRVYEALETMMPNAKETARKAYPHDFVSQHHAMEGTLISDVKWMKKIIEGEV